MAEIDKSKLGVAKFYAQTMMHAQVIIGNIPQNVFDAAEEVRGMNRLISRWNGVCLDYYKAAWDYTVKTFGADIATDFDWDSFRNGIRIFFDPFNMSELKKDELEDLEYYISFVNVIGKKHGLEPGQVDDYFWQELNYFEEGLRVKWSD